MSRLFIYCGGGTGKEVLEIAKDINKISKRWDEIYFIDDSLEKDYLNDIRVVNWQEYTNKIRNENDEIIIANGEPYIKKKIYYKLKKIGCNIATIVDPNVNISDFTKLGEGVIIGKGAILTTNIELKKCVFVNVNSTISHDVCVGEFVTISPGCNICGNVNIGDLVYIGTGAIIRDEINIGSESVVGMGAVVTKNIEHEVVAFGAPAKIIRKNTDKRVFK